MRKTSGFTLIEVLVMMATIGALSAIAISAYQAHQHRMKIHDAFNNLIILRADMEKYWQVNHNFGSSGCGASMPANTKYFHFICNINNSRRGYLLTAKGLGNLLNYNFTIDTNGNQVTTDFPGVSGLPVPCWIDQPGSCVN